MSASGRSPLRPSRTALIAAPLAAWLFASAGCGADPATEHDRASLASRLDTASALTVDTTLRYQRITGFGASSAWTGGSISDADADVFFTSEKGIGLSLLRMHIAPDGTSTEMVTAKRAAARGASVWAAPWSPPGAWKTNGTDNHGGSLLPEYYAAWADELSGFAASMAAEGVPLLALSAQNEPNWSADWETCLYTPDELVTFVRDYLRPSLERDSPDTVLLGPETANWTTFASFADPLLADPDANAALGILATHAYGGTPRAFPAAADNGKELWETEVSYEASTPMLAALTTAREVHRHLVVGGVNAFHYWWLVSDTTGGLMTDGELTPQAYGLAHFSKFVRPGSSRVDLSGATAAGVSSSAYVDPASGRSVIVVVNETASDVPLSFRLEGTTPVEVTPWVTNAAASLARQRPIPFADPFDYVFTAESVTSLILSKTAEPADGGEGGSPGAAGASDAEAGTNGDTGSAGAAEPAQGGTGGTKGSGGTESNEAGASSKPPGSRGGSSNHGGRSSGVGGSAGNPANAGSATQNAAPTHKPGAYMTCGVTSGSGAKNQPLIAGLLTLLLGALRRRPASAARRS